jgi:hypothetical protein
MAGMIARFNLTEYVPLPWTGLFYQQNVTVLLEQTLVERREEYQITDRLLTGPNILPLAQITLQRAKEMESLAERFQTEAADLQPVCLESQESSILVSSILEGNLNNPSSPTVDVKMDID